MDIEKMLIKTKYISNQVLNIFFNCMNVSLVYNFQVQSIISIILFIYKYVLTSPSLTQGFSSGTLNMDQSYWLRSFSDKYS